jgi:hypothetical protein
MEHLTESDMIPLTQRAVKTMKEKQNNPKWQRIISDSKLRFNEAINEQERWLRNKKPSCRGFRFIPMIRLTIGA